MILKRFIPVLAIVSLLAGCVGRNGESQSQPVFADVANLGIKEARTTNSAPAAPPKPAQSPAPQQRTPSRPQQVAPPANPPAQAIVTPATGLQGKVVSVNTLLRFVIVNFPVGTMASIDQRMAAYRGGMKVGELKISGPRQEDNIVADITAGNVEVGDEIREL